MLSKFRLRTVISKTFPSETKSRKRKKNDNKIEWRGVERKRKKKVKIAVSLLNPKTISKFCFLRMPKIRQVVKWELNKRIAAVISASGNDRIGLCALPSMGFAVNFRFLDQKTARFSAKFPGGMGCYHCYLLGKVMSLLKLQAHHQNGNGLSKKNLHLDLRMNSCSEYWECTKDSSEQLAYPTMCVDEQETGHGRIIVVYPDTEYISYKEPHEGEHNFSSFTRLVFLL